MSDLPGKPTPAIVATEPISPEDMEPVTEIGICHFCHLPIYDLDEWDYGQPVVNNSPSLWHKYCGDHPNEVTKK